MSYEAIALKYRPRTFDDLVGQEAIAQTVRNAVARGRVANVSIFAGPHGVGKTSTARILAKALNCTGGKEGDGNPCNACPTCESIGKGASPDVIEIDAASHNGVDEIRPIRDNIRYRPAQGGFKVYILDEAHQLSKAAFNALLKTFEEPPEHARFVLATTELAKVPATIRSRGQVFEFRRVGPEAVRASLAVICEKEGVAVDDGVLELIARRTRGSVRDSQKTLDQAIALKTADALDDEAVRLALGLPAAEIVGQTLDGLAAGEPRPCLEAVRDVYAAGAEPQAFVGELMEALRGVIFVRECGADADVTDELLLPPASLRRWIEGTEDRRPLGRESVLIMLSILAETRARMRTARDERVILETALVRLCRTADLASISELVARLERLESRLGGAASGPPPGRGAGPSSGGGGGGTWSGGPSRAAPYAATAPAPRAAPAGREAPPPSPASREAPAASERRPSPGGPPRADASAAPAPREPRGEPAADESAPETGPAAVDLERVEAVYHDAVADLQQGRGVQAARAWRAGTPTGVAGRTVTVTFEGLIPMYEPVVRAGEERRAFAEVLGGLLGVSGLSVSADIRGRGKPGVRRAAPKAAPSGASGAPGRADAGPNPPTTPSAPREEPGDAPPPAGGGTGRILEERNIQAAVRELRLVPLAEQEWVEPAPGEGGDDQEQKEQS